MVSYGVESNFYKVSFLQSVHNIVGILENINMW